MLFFIVFTMINNRLAAQITSTDLVGAWETAESDTISIWIVTDEHFAVTKYNTDKNQFFGSLGGSWKLEDGIFVGTFEFNSFRSDLVGKQWKASVKSENNSLITINPGQKQPGIKWNRIDDGTPGKLAGAWLITGRMREGTMHKMTPGARRTMKILSGTRFQWIAYNVETKEFSGTGGGTYATENGKYTENILFFSRDNTRVGATLQFDYAIEDENWRHKGKSSKGEPIDEVWTKREKIGL